MRMEEPIEPLDKIFKELPPNIQQQVRDFAEFLLKKWRRKPAKKLRQDWAGALKDYRNQYTSLELQRKALEWRGD